MIIPTPTQVCILGRTNSALIERALDEIEGDAEIMVHFAATSRIEKWNPRIPYHFQDLLDVLALFEGNTAAIRGHYFRQFESWAEFMVFVEAGDQELKYLSRIVEKFGARLRGALARLEQASCAPDAADLFLSTAHRAKGLEWDIVELLGDFADPAELETMISDPNTPAESRRELLEEANLLYVAVTRARRQVALPEPLRRWLNTPSTAGGADTSAVGTTSRSTKEQPGARGPASRT